MLSGVDEARLTFLAARRWYGWDAGRLLVIDIGGGSLEVAMGSDEDPTVALSVPAGAGRVTREFLPESGVADDDDLEAARKNIRKILEPMVKAFPKSKHPMHAVGTSKTIRSLARLAGAVMRQPGRVDTSIMTIDQLEDWLPRLAAIAPDQRTALPGVTPERTYQIVGGGLVIDEIMKALDVKEIEICPWALREGAILRWLDQFGRTRLGFLRLRGCGALLRARFGHVAKPRLRLGCRRCGCCNRMQSQRLQPSFVLWRYYCPCSSSNWRFILCSFA